jgi:hypothetical protein
MVRRFRRTSTAIIGASVMVLAACGDDGDGLFGDVEAVAPEGFAATPTYLRSVAERSAAESYRYEMWMTFGDYEPTDDPMFLGAVDGELMWSLNEEHAGLDSMNASLEEAIGPVATIPREEATRFEAEMVNEGDRTHMRLPYLLDASDDALYPEARELKSLVQETDGWFTIHTSQMLDLSAEEFDQSSFGNPVDQDPGALIDVISEAQDARELGVSEVRGEDVVGIEAEIGFVEMLEADGIEAEDFADAFLGSMMAGMAPDDVPPSEVDRVTEAVSSVMLELTMPTEVWVDGDGYLRRIAYSMDLEDFVFAVTDRLGEEPPPGGAFGLSMRFTMDVFDYGEEMGITVPEATVDLTERPDLFDYWALVNLADEL